ncbi:MAG: RIP metalloprotease RseP [Pseudomonadota bacterium]
MRLPGSSPQNASPLYEVRPLDFLTTLIPSFGNLAFTLVAFIVALSIIVAIHEYGHYIVGRWCGIKADVFSIGFGKVLFARTDKHGTVWQIAALPFGGYVKFKGDSNAASIPDGSAPAEATYDRDSMLGAPLWARSATVAAGPVFNFILSFLMFSALLMAQGRPLTPLTLDQITPMPAAYQMELEPGDRILSVEGQIVDYDDPAAFDALIKGLPSQPVLTYVVERGRDRIEATGPHLYSTLVGNITPRSAADDADLQAGDVVLSMNGTPVYKFTDMIAIVDEVRDQPIALEVWRDGEVIVQELTPRMTAIPQEDGSLKDEPKLGIGADLFFEPATTDVGLLEALSRGVEQVWYIIVQSINGIGALIMGAINTCNMNGPIGIAETSGSMASQGVISFLSFIAVLSTAVGLLNLFPIPMLDGGHLVFHAYEAVFRRPPSDKALQILMAAGISIIGSLMIFAILNDWLLCP